MLQMAVLNKDEGPEVPRYEFRVFGDAAAKSAERFGTQGNKTDFECRTDVYILFKDRLDFGLKLRADELDLKLLMNRHGDFELWQPVRRITMPLTGRDIAEGFLPTEMAEMPLNPDRIHDHNALLEVLGPLENVRIFRVAKERHRFAFDDHLGEVTVSRILGNGTHVTCAVEGADPTRLKDLRQELGLKDCENTSYPSFLTALEPTGGSDCTLDGDQP
ncbi:hypothetical protein [Amaricoccus tamworthensis]|uniref:hypothetical protein n=1 Tax=Amaricoccus tamworthensis TaxID=57002 RepID=UPI003C7BC689